MMRAWRSRWAWAWRDMASSRPDGIFTSRISTDCTVMPQGFVFSSRIRCSSRPMVSRSVIICASSWRPIDSRSAVCALMVMASMKFSTSRIDFSAFQTSQKTMASTFRDGIARERGLGGDAGDADALVHVGAERLKDRDDVAQARAAQADIAAQAQDGDLFPLAHDLDREQKVDPDQGSDDGRGGMVDGPGHCDANYEADYEQQEGNATDFVLPNIRHDVYLLFGNKSRRRSIRSSRVKPAAPARAANSPAIWAS